MRLVSANAILTICQQCKKQLVNDLEQIIQATIWLDQTENGSPSAQCLLKGFAFEIQMKFLVFSLLFQRHRN